MAPSAPTLPTQTRSCPFCGKPVAVHLNRCPSCREEMQHVRVASRSSSSRKEGRAQMRRGLLCMTVAAIIHYLAAGYSGFALPVAIPGFVTAYLTPLLLLGGVGFTLYGVFLYLRS